jgi:hypothetical protein
MIFFALASVCLMILAGVLAWSTSDSSSTPSSDYSKRDSLELSMLNYGKQHMLYKINTNESQDQELIRHALLAYFASNQNKSRSFSLIELTNETINDYVLKKRNESYKYLFNDYYGAIEITTAVRNGSKYLDTNVYYSSVALHSIGAILNEVNGFLLSFYSNNSKRLIRTINAPISSQSTHKSNENSSLPIDNNQDLTRCIDMLPFSIADHLISVTISVLISLVCIHITREKSNGSKSLQMLSGTHFLTYWSSNYLFDMMLYLISIIVMLAALTISSLARGVVDTDAYILSLVDANLLHTFMFMLINALSWPLVAYLCSFKFKSDIIAFIVVFIVLNLALLFDLICVLIILSGPSSSTLSNVLHSVVNITRTLLLIVFPNIQAKRAVFNIGLRKNDECIDMLSDALSENLSKGASLLAYNEPGIGKFILLSLLHFMVSAALLIAIELGAKTNMTRMTKGIKQLIYSSSQNAVNIFRLFLIKMKKLL